MWVWRQTVRVKYGCLQAYLDLNKDTFAQYREQFKGFRLYLPTTGDFTVCALECDFEDMGKLNEGGASLVDIMKKWPKSSHQDQYDALIEENSTQIWWQE